MDSNELTDLKYWQHNSTWKLSSLFRFQLTWFELTVSLTIRMQKPLHNSRSSLIVYFFMALAFSGTLSLYALPVCSSSSGYQVHLLSHTLLLTKVSVNLINCISFSILPAPVSATTLFYVLTIANETSFYCLRQ